MNAQQKNIIAFEREIAAESAIRNEATLEAQCQRLRKRCLTLTCYLVAVLVAAVLSGYHYQHEMEKLRRDFPKQAVR